MPRYSQEIIQQVMEANDLVDIVSQYTKLKRSGHSYMGCCPFHNERTPSFSVSRDKQLYHCFGCGVGGNVFTFVMEKENMSFPEALSYLAERGGIALPKTTWQDDKAYQKKEAMFEMNRLLANHYYTLLKHNDAATVYAKSRGFNSGIIHEFGIGYSADSWQETLNYLTKKKCDVGQMLEAGIEIRSDSGRIYDRFRNRLMIPIQNSRGKIIGFGGRMIQKDGNGPKYLNSPESIIFSKGRELFNLNRAKKHIVNDQLIIVEGYMDVIALYQQGVQNVVAALGTAFTPDHAKILNRYVNEIVLCFDGDAAGEKATQRAIDILRHSNLKILVVRLNEKDDPDSYVRNNGADAFREKVSKAKSAIEYQLDFVKKNNALKTTEQRLDYVSKAVPIIATAKSDIEKDVFSKMVAEQTGVSATMILDAAKRIVPQSSEKPSIKPSEHSKKGTKAVDEAERYVMAALLNGKLSLEDFSLDKAVFSIPLYQAAYETIKKMHDANESINPALVIASFNSAEDQKALSSLALSDNYAFDTDKSSQKLRESLEIMRKRYEKLNIRTIQEQINALPLDDPETVKLLQEIITLKNQGK